MSCDMQGYATHRDLYDLWYRLSFMTEPERKAEKFCLFVSDRGFLDGQEAYEYLMNRPINIHSVREAEYENG